jgi:site-specific DNA-methyltransferase (adenine-specific)
MIKGETYTVHIGNNLDILPTLPDNSVDSIVTDPPYELGFMGKKWDSSGIAYSVELWRECLRVLKPGGHLLSFGGTRTWHRVAVGIEDAGFEVRDSIAWMYGSGFPKSLNLKDEWQGWGTALKPAFEPIVVARKPLIGTVAENVLTHGTGALNIDGSRIDTQGESWSGNKENAHSDYSAEVFGKFSEQYAKPNHPQGRWPANVILDEYSAEVLDEQSGLSNSIATKRGLQYSGSHGGLAGESKEYKAGTDYIRGHNDSGGASRFFYVAKASKRDRNEGLEELPDTQTVGGGGGIGNYLDDVNSASGKFGSEKAPAKNFHPTVKPTQLMRYLVKLVTPPGGTVLDPFTGSGSTGKAAILEGFTFIGCELTEDYIPIIEGRLKHAEQLASEAKDKEDEALF